MKVSQNEIILNHIKEYGRITTYDAFKYYNITRLAARIFDLRQLGYHFVVSHGHTESGKSYAIYELVSKEALND